MHRDKAVRRRTPAGGRWRSRAIAVAGLVCAVVAGLSAVLGCAVSTVSGPPLVVLDVFPADRALAQGSPVRLIFNLPVDAASLAGRLSVSPACQHSVSVAGQEVVVQFNGPVPGRTYTLSVRAGARGTGGAVLQQDFAVSLAVLPGAIAQPAGGGDAGPGPAAGSPVSRQPSLYIPACPPVTGARLFLEGSAVFACDRPGFYDVPRFDRVVLYLAGSESLDAALHPALLEVRPDGSVRRLATRQAGGPGWVELILEEETRAGCTYEYCVVAGTGTGPQGAVTHTLYAWSVHGSPWIYVWALDVASGRVSPVGRLDLGMEADALVGDPGGMLAAVGSPGGVIWAGLQVVQVLSPQLAAAGPPVAVFADGNYLPRQIGAGGKSIVVVGPAEPIPARPWESTWGGFAPGGGPDAPGAQPTSGRAGTPPLDRGTDTNQPVLIEVRQDGVRTLLQAWDLPGRYVSGPALSRDGTKVAFLTQDFADHALIRVWSCTLLGGPGVAAIPGHDPFPRELARLVYPNDTIGDFGYGGGACWNADGGGLWWDVCLPDGTIEIWTVDATGGARSLVISGAALPLVSPDGRMLFCLSHNGGVILAADGTALRGISGQLTAGAWLPDSSGLLVSDRQGVQMVPVSGPAQRLVSFPASPGCFVGPTEYWFVSDRRF